MSKFNIYELSKNTKTVIHTSMFYYNSPTLDFVLKTLNILMMHYFKNGNLSGNMAIQIIRNLESTEAERFLM